MKHLLSTTVDRLSSSTEISLVLKKQLTWTCNFRWFAHLSLLVFCISLLLLRKNPTGLRVEDECGIVTDRADEDPISSPMMFLRDWAGPIEIVALSNECGEKLLFQQTWSDLDTWRLSRWLLQTHGRIEQTKNVKTHSLDIVLTVKTIATPGLVMICLLPDIWRLQSSHSCDTERSEKVWKHLSSVFLNACRLIDRIC